MLGVASSAMEFDKLVSPPTFMKVAYPSFEETYGNDMDMLGSIVQQEINILKDAGVTGVYVDYPYDGNRRARYTRAVEIALANGIDIYVPFTDVRHGEEYDGTIYGNNYPPIRFSGVTLHDEPIYNRKSSTEVTRVAVEAKKYGVPVVISFSASEKDHYRDYLTKVNGSGRRLIDYVDVLQVGEYGSKSPSSFRYLRDIASDYGKEFRIILGQESKGVQHLQGQLDTGYSVGFDGVSLWTMDGYDDGQNMPTRTSAGGIDECRNTSGMRRWKNYGGGFSYTHVVNYDYGNIVYEDCMPGDPEPWMWDSYDDVESRSTGWAFKSIVESNSEVWRWWSNQR